MNNIHLNKVLPKVFVGAENESPVKDSDLWLHEIKFVKGRTYLVVAESGTGKSSLCSFIYGKRSDYNGTIKFDNDDIRSFDIKQWSQLRRTNIAYLPQEMKLFPELTAMENVELKNNLTGYKSQQEISALFEALEISSKKDSKAAILSIGQQQRVAIIRALCQPFDFIILDEPVSHLDKRNNAIVAEIVKGEAEKQGAGVIATSVGNHLSITADEIIKL